MELKKKFNGTKHIERVEDLKLVEKQFYFTHWVEHSIQDTKKTRYLNGLIFWLPSFFLSFYLCSWLLAGPLSLLRQVFVFSCLILLLPGWVSLYFLPVMQGLASDSLAFHGSLLFLRSGDHLSGFNSLPKRNQKPQKRRSSYIENKLEVSFCISRRLQGWVLEVNSKAS